MAPYPPYPFHIHAAEETSTALRQHQQGSDILPHAAGHSLYRLVLYIPTKHSRRHHLSAAGSFSRRPHQLPPWPQHGPRLTPWQPWLIGNASTRDLLPLLGCSSQLATDRTNTHPAARSQFQNRSDNSGSLGTPKPNPAMASQKLSSVLAPTSHRPVHGPSAMGMDR